MLNGENRNTSDSGKVRLTAILPRTEVEALKRLSSSQNIPMNEALRRAIVTESVVLVRRNSGSKILLEKNGSLSELVFAR